MNKLSLKVLSIILLLAMLLQLFPADYASTASQSPWHTTYTYDELGRLVTVAENNIPEAVYTYDINGNRASLAYANGTSTSYAYNLANLVTSLTNSDGSAVLSSYGYTYYLDGNQAAKTDHTGLISTYIYDGLGRLTSETEHSSGLFAQSYSYTYDLSHNRLSMTKSGSENGITTYEYDLNNRLTKETNADNAGIYTTQYTCDHNGNQVLKYYWNLTNSTGGTPSVFLQPGGGLDTFVYDGLNRLIAVEVGGVQAEYTYKTDGLRISKTVGGNTTRHIWDGANISAELDDIGTVIAVYVRGVNLILAVDNNGVIYYLFNAHGDVVQLADAGGAVVKSYKYDAFGVEWNPSSGDANPFRYCGEYWDGETGTYYLRFRHYDPRIGRFTQEDPIKAGLNWYTYCNNNPILFIDPWGLIPSIDEAAAMAKHIAGATDRHIRVDLGSEYGGWQLIHIHMPDWYGLKIGVYSRVVGGIAEYALVSKGTTDPTSMIDDLLQLVGMSKALEESIRFAMSYVTDLRKTNPDVEVTMVGHSKGGLEATWNAIVTGTNCITFNPMVITFFGIGMMSYSSAIEAHKTRLYKGEVTMNHYVVDGDILNKLFGQSQIGTTVYLPTQAKNPWFLKIGPASPISTMVYGIRNHVMDAVVNALAQNKASGKPTVAPPRLM
ncbi:MAG: hypothetical protein FWF18_04310 [Dehalococcoidia bacterium]|nr:hypothetical protein [Dehalococcoidia bacterium]